MNITDPIADMLTRIRNASSAKHKTVDIPASNMKRSIAEILLREGYIKAVEEIKYCLDNNISFTQETTLSGHRTEKTIQQARKQGYYVIMYYVGLNSKEESLARIENRVRKGGHDIPKNDVCRRFDNRFDSLKRIVPLCDEVIFYDNENGFIKVAEIKNNKFNYSNGYRPKWITEFENKLKLG